MAIQLEPKTRVSTKRHFVTLAEYDRMVASGVFEVDAAVELLKGEIVDMSPPGPDHEAIVSRLHMLLGERLRRRVILWPQGNSIGLPQSNSRPQPDITLLNWRDDYYAGQRPQPKDVILLVEVSDSTLKSDRGVKQQLYAQAGIQEYWIINLVDGVVEVYSNPGDNVNKYQNVRIAGRGEKLTVPLNSGAEIAVNDILGPDRRS